VTDVWSPLSDHDPVPGDPWQLNELARHFDDRAVTIGEVIRGLQRLDAAGMRSVFVDQMIAQRDEVIPNLRLLEQRWDRTAEALRGYCPILEQAQEMAAKARRDSWAAQAEIERAQAALEAQAEAAAQPAFVPANPQPAFIAAPPDHEAALDAARAAMRAAERLLEDAVEVRDRGERAAADAIDDAAHDDLRNRGGFFDFIGDLGEGIANAAGAVVGAVADVGEALWDAGAWIVDNFPSLKQLSDILGVVSGILTIVGLFFPPAALAGTIVGGVKLAVDVGLMTRGEGSWFDVATGALSLATLGVGRYARVAAQASGAAQTGTAGVRMANVAGQIGTQAATAAEAATRTSRLSRHIGVAVDVASRVGLGDEAIGVALWAERAAELAPSAAQVARGAETVGDILDAEGVWGAASTVSGGWIPNLETMIKEAQFP
jgi:hypothetical protein